MIAKQTAGRSFKGVTQYVLHDKNASSTERVAFVETVNLPTNDPRRATAHMIDTATHAKELKQAAGLQPGRTLEKPVYHYTLAWHPTEQPTHAQQIEAARESLKALGMDDRQALIVSHRDTEHAHVHVIVNRVCPETGKAASLSNDRLKLSEWASEYEKKHGKVFCQEREKNQEARKRGQWVKDNSPSRSAWLSWKKAETKSLWAEYRADRDAAREGRRGQYEALWRQRQERLAARKGEVKQLYKPKWRELYRKQREDLKQYDDRLGIRLRHAVRTKGYSVINMFRAMVNDQVTRQQFIDSQSEQRRDLGKHQQQTIADASREVTKAWKYDRDQLKEMHRQQDKTRLADTKAKTAAVWEQQPTRQGQTEQAKQAEKKPNTQKSSLKSALKAAQTKYQGDDDQARSERKARKERRRKRDRERSRGDKGRTMDR